MWKIIEKARTLTIYKRLSTFLLLLKRKKCQGWELVNLKNFTKTENDGNLSKNAKTLTVKKERVLNMQKKQRLKNVHAGKGDHWWNKDSKQNQWKENRFLQSVKQWRFCGMRKTWKAQIAQVIHKLKLITNTVFAVTLGPKAEHLTTNLVCKLP